MALISDYKGKWITKEDLFSDMQLLKDLKQKFKKDYTYTSSFIVEKRNLFTEIWQKYTDPAKYKGDEVKIHTLHSTVKAFEANYSDADLSVSFEDDMSLESDFSYNMEVAARLDSERMNKQMKDHQKLHDALLYGVGISIKTGYDELTGCPTWDSVHPANWIPDMAGNSIENNFVFHCIESQVTKAQLEEVNASVPGGDVYFDIDKVNTSSFYNDRNSPDDRKKHRGLKVDERYRGLKIVDYYCTLAGRKYVATFANMGSLLIRFERIEPVTEQERKHPELIPHPVVAFNIFPLRDDPYGLGYGEILLTNQNAINRLMNLALLKEQRAAGFQNYIVDVTTISDIDSLGTRNDEGPVFVPARPRGNKSVQGAVAPVQEEGASGNTIELSNVFNQRGQNQTSMTDQNRGVAQNIPETLGQSEIAQMNANILFLLDYAFIANGERHFYKNIWLRTKIEYMTKTEKQVYQASRGFGAKKFELTREDFESVYSPYIKVTSRRIENLKNRQKIAYLISKYDSLAADPRTPPVALKILARKIDEMNNVSREDIYLMNPLTPDERRAKGYCYMINNYKELGRPQNLIQPGMDPFTYYVYISYCDDNEVKAEVMAQLEAMLIEQGQMQKAQEVAGDMQQARQSQLASRSSQMTSNFIQSMNQDNKTPSLQDIRA